MKINELEPKKSLIRSILFTLLSFIVPLVIYIIKLEPKVIGGDTTYFAIQLPQMQVMVPTGYPLFSLLMKFMSIINIGDLAYRLNLFSAIFAALSTLFLYLAIKRLIKNDILSLISTYIFAFVFAFFEIARRFEFDSLSCFTVALLIYSLMLYGERELKIYSDKGIRKYLYFASFCLGLSLTNHPIVFFAMPGFLLYLIIARPRVLKSIKAILISIAFFILPLLSYSYIYIRSRQGYGPADTFQKFFYHITGRTQSGGTFGGTFGTRGSEVAWEVFKDYFTILYENLGIFLLVVAVAGFIYMMRKNLKFGICSAISLLSTFIIASNYLGWANSNYALIALMIMTIYIAYGFKLILDYYFVMFKKLVKNKKQLRIDRILKNIGLVALIAFFAFQPAILAYFNYSRVGSSEPEDVYKFWDEAFTNMEKGSRVYVLAYSENVGEFVDIYEKQEKEIEYITHKNPRYSIENMEKDVEEGKTVYFVEYVPQLARYFDAEKIGNSYYWFRYGEVLQLYRIKEKGAKLEASYEVERSELGFGDTANIKLTIKNNTSRPEKVTSIELDLPDNLEFVDVSEEGYISQGPGISQGKFMWVSDEYIVEGDSTIDLIVGLRATAPGEAKVKFMITAFDLYIEVDDILLEIKD